MLVASRPIGLLDRYGVPYVIDPSIADGFVRLVRADETGVELVSLAAAAGTAEQLYVFDGAVWYGALSEQSTFEAKLSEAGRDWTEAIPITDIAGDPRAWVQCASDGSVTLPFDIDEPFEAFFRERYVPRSASRFRKLVRHGYYLVRPILPYWFQMTLRRRFRRFQDKSAFPAWPTETSLHRLEALMLALIERVAGEPLPWLYPWPKPYTWAMVLTHDIERAAGYRHVRAVLAVEEKKDLRSAWYFVPERDYTVDESMLEQLKAAGCEICLHGLRHDGRDMSPRTFHDRLPSMRSYIEWWGARGFRAPATHRDRQLIQELGIDHDSSWSDVARYEPQPGGTCSWLPFFIGEVVELPITLPMDHTLFELRRERTADRWIEKAAFLREQGGMALIVTHPDYLLDRELLSAYEHFLTQYALDSTAWRALPSEMAAWWRSRADLRIERRDGAWAVVGSGAAEACLRLGAPLPSPASAFVSDRSL